MISASILDADHIIEAMMAGLAGSPAAHMKYLDLEKAKEYVCQAIADKHVWVCGSYGVMVDVGCDWYSSTPYLIEQLVFKFPGLHSSPAQPLHYVLNEGLTEIAKYFGCRVVVAGDTQIGYMTPKYLQAGFQVLGTQLIKEIP